MAMDEILEFAADLWFVPPILWLACGVVWLVRGRSAGAIVGSIGCLVLFLVGIPQFVLRRLYEGEFETEMDELVEFAFELQPWMPLLWLVGLALILAGLSFCRFRAAPSADPYGAPVPPPLPPDAPTVSAPGAYAQAAPGYGMPPPMAPLGPPAPLERPGWTLAGLWIAFSALAWFFGLVALVLVLDAGSRISRSEMKGIMTTYTLWFVFLVPAVILFFVWLYRAWASVPPEYRSTSPGRAVGFLFIPFYNIYWIFRAMPGLSASTRRAQEGLTGAPAGGGAYGIGIAAAVISIIPYVNTFAWIFVMIWVILANGARNRLLMTRAAMGR
jgi:hypothetical protein